MMKYAIGWLGLIFVCALSHAEGYICSNTFRTISTGDTTEAVAAACGSPASTSTRIDQVQTPAFASRWIYALDFGRPSILSAALMRIAISFQDNHVVQIEKNGLLLSAIEPVICIQGGQVKLGDDTGAVLRACGTPNYTAEQQILLTTPKTILVWTYNFGPARPQAILEFENNVLQRILNGPSGS